MDSYKLELFCLFVEVTFVNLVFQYSDSEIESLFENITAGTSSADNTSGGFITAPKSIRFI